LPTAMTAICLACGRISIYTVFRERSSQEAPYIKKEWCMRVLEQPIRSEPQEKNRYRFWAEIPELEGRFLRVITLEDKVTIHNAFPDRRFKP
jgi:hypothetical protein